MAGKRSVLRQAELSSLWFLQMVGSLQLYPGKMLGNYELLSPLAEGGMAAVWAARLKGSHGFAKTVAIKTILPDLSNDVNFEEMFLDEARLASTIRHPCVVEVLNLGEADGLLYQVMEWVDGESLASLRRYASNEEKLPIHLAVYIIREACAGLHAAHELRNDHGDWLGLVHRDVSPQNLLVAFDGSVKVVDFGVAKAHGRSAPQTSAGQIKGKAPYMSPEQAMGEEVDRRTDVFALGIVLYQLVTGRHPFRGENDFVTLQKIVSDKAIEPPIRLLPELSFELQRVMLRALERDPILRYPSAREFSAALGAATVGLEAASREGLAGWMDRFHGGRGRERREVLERAIRELSTGSVTALRRTQAALKNSQGSLDAYEKTVVETPVNLSRGNTARLELEVAGVKQQKNPLLLLGALLAVLGLSSIPIFFNPFASETDSTQLSPPAEAVVDAPSPAKELSPGDLEAAQKAKEGNLQAETAVVALEKDESPSARKAASEGASAQGKSAAVKVDGAAKSDTQPKEQDVGQSPKKFVPPPVQDPGF